MTLEQLRIFLMVAEHQHFTRAAEALFVTQPAVSAAIHSLEEEYGVKLFHRIGRRVEITAAGKLLQVEAQKILDQVTLAERGMRELNTLQRGELKLGASLNIANYWLPEKISQFKRQYPQIQVICDLANADEICHGTATGLFDLGLVTGGVKPVLQDSLEQDIVGYDRLQIVVGRNHPWFGQSHIAVEDLPTTEWVMREPGSGAQRMFEKALQTWGLDAGNLNVVLVLASSEMVKAVVESGVGAAALPELMVQKEIQLDVLHALPVIDLQQNPDQKLEIVQPVLKLKHQQRFQSRPAIAFEGILQAGMALLTSVSQ
ncbi:LysR family transcriptional regulator [Leptolyngbya sp. 'hensonii']|uniref:LysR substrate-binding domain-containing protein n=1 Tax=Leptolyngbya sp. 'hensonii' TaxID=1922337 RepID=UPI00094F9D04|nr:LysR substrate-binding domain-containing protein [Leptolyngbya sp. 'hensonii']OLP15454.1 LysR family transcriptional regulator [Leptolyngbya sp. 'hensonii']